MQSVILNKRQLLPDWKHLCFYLKIGILLCSSVWFDPSLHPTSKQHIIDIMSFVIALVKKTPDLDFVAVAKMITFRWEVILLLSEFRLLPTELFNESVEHWLKFYFTEFKHFIETFTIKKVPEQTCLALRNALTVCFSCNKTYT